MNVGFSLVTETPNTIADVHFDTDKTEPQVFALGVYKDELPFYRDALIRARCTRNTLAFDMDRQKYIELPNPLFLMFFECKAIVPDYVGVSRIADKTFKTVFLDCENKSHKGKVKSGYTNIDDFINKYIVIDMDNRKIYSPYDNPFNKQYTDDFERFIATYGQGYTNNSSYKFIHPETQSYNGIEMSTEEFCKSDYFYEVFFGILCESQLFEHCPLIFVSETLGDWSKKIPTRQKGDRTILISGV